MYYFSSYILLVFLHVRARARVMSLIHTRMRASAMHICCICMLSYVLVCYSYARLC